MGIPKLHAAVGRQGSQAAQVLAELDIPHLVVPLLPRV